MRMIFAVAMLQAGMAMPALAQLNSNPWRQVVADQIQALHERDGTEALLYVVEDYRRQFAGRGDAFLETVVKSGFRPIVEARSHSFGDCVRINDYTVVQVVHFVGPNQRLYEAEYQLMDEPGEGWRIEGVTLQLKPGIADH
jgi:hypothetical protein